MTNTPFVQIAGIIDEDEASLLLELNVPFLGFPLRLGYHQPDLSEEEAKRIIKVLSLQDSAILITYLKDSDEILSLMDYLDVRRVQLHGSISVLETEMLRRADSSLWLMKSIIVRPTSRGEMPTITREIESYEPFVDAFITDTFDPQSSATGATGKTHDWAVSREIVSLSTTPVVLAGGLDPANIAEAINTVRPWGVDAHTGVEEATGRKSRELVSEFLSVSKQLLT